ncbi:MAG: beta-lactamase family protein [Verrucomicrobiales bacterium]|nr:beta-lactamase family protein [Verrucomicrobiales bacterium]
MHHSHPHQNLAGCAIGASVSFLPRRVPGLGGLFFSLLVAIGGSASQGQSLKIRPAIELSLTTQSNVAYQLEKSVDLSQWRPFESSFIGTGGSMMVLASTAESTPGFYRVSTNSVRDLNPLLEPIRAANKVPALACAVVISNKMVGLGAVGFRKSGVTSAPVTVQDKWHQGSLTKSMTATLAAILVQEGKIRWTATLEEVFPDWAGRMNVGWRGATLEQLASNRGGAPGDLGPSGIWAQLWNFAGTPREGRRLLLEKLTVLPPARAPGTGYEYSNAGFALAGHMLETVTGTPWEDLLRQRLFVPLGMSSAGYGVPATPRYVDQPWGHQFTGGQAVPVEPGTSADNPPAIGPAGTVHCTVIDLARYAGFHAAAHHRELGLLPVSAMLKLHTAYPNNASYAHGWIEVDRPWAAPGKAYTHNGSNLQWFSVIWFAPAKEFAVVALCNVASGSGANPGATATDEAAWKMIQTFLNQ